MSAVCVSIFMYVYTYINQPSPQPSNSLALQTQRIVSCQQLCGTLWVFYPGGMGLWMKGLRSILLSKVMVKSPCQHLSLEPSLYMGFFMRSIIQPFIFTSLLLIFPFPASLLYNNCFTACFAIIYLGEALFHLC